MKQKIMLSVQGRQAYMGQTPDTIELVTEGWMEFRDGGWDISYEETENPKIREIGTIGFPPLTNE